MGMNIREAIEKLVNRIDLSEAETIDVMNQIMTGEASPLQVAAFLTALRMKGESVGEITGAARVMREKAHRVNVGAKTVLDTCGTGGDQKGTFNISTTTAFVLAGAGVNVAKHGNRSVSSQSGSADVLGALGVKVDAPKERVEQCIAKIGIGFLFAPLLHEAMKYAVQPRRDIGIRTIFNILGPLTNPAMATHQLIGIYSGEMVGMIAQVLKKSRQRARDGRARFGRIGRNLPLRPDESRGATRRRGERIRRRAGAIWLEAMSPGRIARRQSRAERADRKGDIGRQQRFDPGSGLA